MPVLVAQILVGGAAVYVGVGILAAIPLLLRGVGAMDPAARDATRGFRLMIAPGVVALWPLLLRRWLKGGTAPPVEHNAHRDHARPMS